MMTHILTIPRTVFDSALTQMSDAPESKGSANQPPTPTPNNLQALLQESPKAAWWRRQEGRGDAQVPQALFPLAVVVDLGDLCHHHLIRRPVSPDHADGVTDV